MVQWIAAGIAQLSRTEAAFRRTHADVAGAALARSESVAGLFSSVAPNVQPDTLPDVPGLDVTLRLVLDDALGPMRRERAWLESLQALSDPPRTIVLPPRVPAHTTMTTSETFGDGDDFLAAASPVIRADPLLTTRIGSMIAAHAGGVAGDERGYVIRDGEGAPISVAMVPSTLTLDVLPMPAPAIPGLVEAIAGERPGLRGVRGDVTAAGSFAEQWCARTGQSWTPTAHKCLHRLGILDVPSAPGTLRPAAGADDARIVHRWTHEFAAEAVAGDAPPSLPAIARKLESNLAWLWCDETGTPVSYVGASPAAFGVQRIGPVYTPPEHRGHGYASAATAGVAADLDQRPDVDQVCLFTDLANETSNRIYRAIGFEPAFGTIELAFS